MTTVEQPTPQGPEAAKAAEVAPKKPPQRRTRKKESLSNAKRKVQTYGKKKHAIAMAVVGDGFGMIRVNGHPLDLVEPKPMRLKLYEPLFVAGKKKFENIDIHIRVKGGGHVAQVYGLFDYFVFWYPTKK
ncbi:ribosomal protein S16, component of cytosolic 80S ribosome and 40S small subunit [Reticulomyxa filosa]|uniref:Ribosomal protein S16, component of cytosolic 80S ribosome and 40S small subunit n=1 Tax=Reticulomyxa filosa TaxID=46433 RepID=X6M9L7_RETFI|nr:ribosomal protein S16, component of cytosolic 80S ribosome and 40S small subunit [Reticulomyxa filosa]|eukprot:ETO10172.1 ribosomal protein S16, component of cytosolic 80S ribosome and 40S small subunit [Reticulomyxa filosa]